MITALSSGPRRAFRTLALWLGLAALMIQGLAPLCAGPMGGASGHFASIIICTVHGSQTVQIGADGKPLPTVPAKNASDCCSACHAPGGFTASAPIAIAIPSRIAFADPLFAAQPFVPARFYSSYATRGPPVLA